MIRVLTVKNIGEVTYDLRAKNARQAHREARRLFGDSLLKCEPLARPYRKCPQCSCAPCCCPPKGAKQC